MSKFISTIITYGLHSYSLLSKGHMIYYNILVFSNLDITKPYLITHIDVGITVTKLLNNMTYIKVYTSLYNLEFII